MSHILKKQAIAGGGFFSNLFGGKSKKPKPPVYNPPFLGEMQYGASYSYAETLDLISDGPIEGLVNRHGRVVDGLEMLQGIYLDDTPVAVTSDLITEDDQIPSIQEEIANDSPMELASTNGIRNCSRFFQELDLQDERSDGGRITAMKSGSPSVEGPIENLEPSMEPSVSMLFFKTRSLSGRAEARGSGEWWVPERENECSIFIRAFIKFRTGASFPFHWYLNGTRQTAQGISDDNAVYRDEDAFKGSLQSLFWADNTTIGESNFFFGIGGQGFGPWVENMPSSWQWQSSGLRGVVIGDPDGGLEASRAISNHGRSYRRHYTSISDVDVLFKETSDDTERFINNEISAILTLYMDNNMESGNPNYRQRKLAADALKNMGWRGQGAPTTTLLASKLKSNCHVVVRVDEDNSNLTNNIATAGGNLLEFVTIPYGATHGYDLSARMRSAGIGFTDCTCPEIGEDGLLTGKMHGFLLFQFDLQKENEKVLGTAEITNNHGAWLTVRGNQEIGWVNSKVVPQKVIAAMKDIVSFRYVRTGNTTTVGVGLLPANPLKYNFANVLAETRMGSENQPPLDYFNKVFIDHLYDTELFGPFSISDRHPQRISENTQMLTRHATLYRNADNYNLSIGSDGIPLNEGSDDKRVNARSERVDYSSWGGSSLSHWNEMPIPLTHTVHNPNVSSVFITLKIETLKDTLIKNVKNVRGNTSNQRSDDDSKDMQIGSSYPAVLNIEIQTGRVANNLGSAEFVQGNGLIPFKTFKFRIVALVEGTTLIDLGNPDGAKNTRNQYVLDLSSTVHGGDINIPFPLPETVTNKQTILSLDGEKGVEAGTIDQDSTETRYVRVTKLSYETNSALLSKVVGVNKVTEIIDCNLPYPYSAIVGTKLDSRAFSSIPRRSYDCKLKKVRIPSNYSPTDQWGKDRRYYDSVTKFDNTVKDFKLVYEGDWDGSFKPELEWTDNPAWILYDLLINQRYGMGQHIEPADINKWELYQIGRFCDAVDDQGYFEGVTDGRGGKEPRYSCNIVFDQGQKVYDAINTIAGIFKGRVFFNNNSINFLDDRPRNPVNLFTNDSVKDGMFFYANNRRDEQFNTIEVGFKDRFDNFAPKIEVIEDEEDIKERGTYKKRIEGIGITSRAMARRMGQHQIFSKITENQTVAFTAGLETLLCQPGDLVIIEDELKTNKANFGKVLDVDVDQQVIRLTNTFVDADMTGVLTVYNPTGRDTIAEITELGLSNRERFTSFEVTGAASATTGAPWTDFTGAYGFSGYTHGYPEASGGRAGETRYQQYPLYTGLWGSPDAGSIGTYLYFETNATGWVFGSGAARSLASGSFIAEMTGAQTLSDFNTGNIGPLDMVTADKRSVVGFANFDGFQKPSFVGPTKGVVESEISVGTPNQLTVLKVTGNILSTPSELQLEGFNNYGSVVSGFDRPEVLPFIKLGSPVKFEIKDASEFLYRVTSMQEQNPNEYLVSATKYITGKFNLIENNISIEDKANTFSYQQAQTVNGITYTTLDAPSITSVTTGLPDTVSQTFDITGQWGAVTNSSGYNVILTFPNGQLIDQSVGPLVYQANFTGLSQVGMFVYSVNALGNNANNENTNVFFDSQYSSTGIFVLYEEMLPFSLNFVRNIRIL